MPTRRTSDVDMSITGRNIEVSPSLREYIQRKLGKLPRLLPPITDFQVEVRREETRSPDHRYIVQATLNSAGTLLRGERRAENIYTAIDEVTEVMERQAERFKGKLYQRGKRGAARLAPPPPPPPPPIARVKRFPVRPLSVEEAVEQMELLGHDFFLFVNPVSGNLNLLYRRREGGYGLIEPEV